MATGPEPEAAPYQRIASHYRSEIDTGALRPGDRLPTVREIAQTWGVARQTADKAIATLRADGLVAGAGRGGTVVADPDAVTVSIAIDEPSGVRVASADVERASRAVASELGVKPGSAVIVVRMERPAQT